MKKLAHALLYMSLVSTTATAYADDLRILAFGDSNTWGWQATEKGFPAQRFNDQQRWAGVLEAGLTEKVGQPVRVVVDGLVGRTTSLANSDAIGLVAAEDFSGKAALPEAIARHQPLDLVIIMLGTNDLQAAHQRPVSQVADAAFDLAEMVKASKNTVYSSYPAPKVLIVSPPPFGDTSKTGLSGLFAAGEAPSTQLGKVFKAEAAARNIAVFDAGSVTATEGVDGVHLSIENHRQLGQGLVAKVIEVINK